METTVKNNSRNDLKTLSTTGANVQKNYGPNVQFQVMERVRSRTVSTGKIYATGKRKTAIAKVWMLNKGSGRIIVNGKSILDYFKRSTYRMLITQPFKILKTEGIYDVECQVLGSGLSGQAGAIRHGISKALNQVSDEFHRTLRSGGFLTRDSRKVERKKCGQPKARKKFQFSKR